MNVAGTPTHTPSAIKPTIPFHSLHAHWGRGGDK